MHNLRIKKQAGTPAPPGNGSEKDCKFHWTDGRTDGRTYGRTDHNSCRYVLRHTKKKLRSPLGRTEFTISLQEPGGNSEQNANVQIFFYINSFRFIFEPKKGQNRIYIGI